MTQEDKDLLLRDLCARLPYGVIMQVTMYDILGKYDEDRITSNVKLSDGNIGYIMRESHWISYKPYLRPMDSMTEEEAVEYCDLQDKFLLSSQYPVTDGYALFDWLNKKMFDFRRLIPKDLALSTEEYNPYKD